LAGMEDRLDGEVKRQLFGDSDDEEEAAGEEEEEGGSSDEP
jgi:hypothetical protein